MCSFYAITREGGWMRATAYHPAEVVVSHSGRRDLIARSVLEHATGDPDLATELAGAFAGEFLATVPPGGVPLAVDRSDLLLWVVRELRKEQP